MKRASYMSSNELIDYLKVGIFAGECEIIAERTPEKDWRKTLRCISTWLKKITDERIKCCDPEQIISVSRRVKHTHIMLASTDQKRTGNLSKDVDTTTVAVDDMYDLVDMSLLSCLKCPQGGCVKECKLRKTYHRLGVMPYRENCLDGECEFRNDPIGEVRAVTPQYQRMTERIT